MKNETETIKYLYVDDNDNGSQSVQNFKVTNVLDFEVIKPTEKRKDIIMRLNDFDGLIVDQQLDEKPNSAGLISDYLGSSLAADIRVLENGKFITENKDVSIPIILFSANPNVPSSINVLGNELFDFTIFKSVSSYKEFKLRIPKYQSRMISLVNGYKILKELPNEEKTVFDCLQIGDNLHKVDSRFLDELHRRNKLTAHAKASFILNELIIKQGILIDEDILAVRLGIDKNESKDNWNKVLDSLNEFGATYKGVFCEGWPRWWMPMVDEWWYQLEGNETYIRFYSAEKRAKLIEEKLNAKLSEKIQLVPAKAKSKFSVHTDYWTICDEFKEPLDIEDGLMRPNQENLYPWQDASYVSIQAAKEGAEVAECEKERLKII